LLLKIHPDNPDERNLQKVVDCLKNGGIVICPTDTVYTLCCDIYKPKSIDRICKIKKIKIEKANFSFICSDLSHLSDFTKHVETSIFKVMRKALPGPFTFILEASKNVPKLFQSNKKTVGIRIPNNNICIEIVRQLENPIMSTSIYDDDDVIEYSTDPELIHEKYKDIVDIIIDGGYGNNVPSTILDCTNGEIEIIRQGLGKLEEVI
jgi:tRNA threonylcarbamoyl adenosine modification protein (Sua5/YciO/YrdC/YwlC family)